MMAQAALGLALFATVASAAELSAGEKGKVPEKIPKATDDGDKKDGAGKDWWKGPNGAGALPEELRKQLDAQKAAQHDKGAESNTMLLLVAIFMSVGVLAFATVLVWWQTHLLREGKLDVDRYYKLTGLIVLLSAGCFLIVGGYGQNQIAPIVGVLGSALGYLFGRDWGGKSEGADQQQPPVPPSPQPEPSPPASPPPS